MRTILLMIRKDLLRKLRSPLGIIVVLAFPVVFSVIIGISFGGQDIPRVHLLVENRDEDFFGHALLSALNSNEVAEYFDVEIVGEEGLARIQKGKGSALLRIPEHFTLDVIDGTPTSLELIRNPAQGIMPEIAEQLTGVLTDVMTAGSRVLRGPLDTISQFTEDRIRIDNQTVAAIAVAVNGSVLGAESYLFPPVIELEIVDLGEPAEEEEDSSSSQAFSIFLFVFPGVSVFALFMVGDVAMRDILTESEAGTLRRQWQGPIGAGTLILSKAGFTAVLCLLSVAILSVTGWIAADRPVSIAGYLLLSLALILSITGVCSAIYGAAGTVGRGATIASVLFIVLAFAGGAFIQLDAMPQIIQAVAPISPFYWGTDGYKVLITMGGGIREILVHLAVLSGLGIATLATGTMLLKRRMTKGGLA